MRVILSVVAVSLLMTASGPRLRAQSDGTSSTPPSNPQLERERRMISFLTPEQQTQYAKARAKALTDNPKLKADGDALLAHADATMASGNPADRQAFIEKMNSHRQMLRQAMLKEDGALGPIFAAIDKHISEMKAKHPAPTP